MQSQEYDSRSPFSSTPSSTTITTTTSRTSPTLIVSRISKWRLSPCSSNMIFPITVGKHTNASLINISTRFNDGLNSRRRDHIGYAQTKPYVPEATSSEVDIIHQTKELFGAHGQFLNIQLQHDSPYPLELPEFTTALLNSFALSQDTKETKHYIDDGEWSLPTHLISSGTSSTLSISSAIIPHQSIWYIFYHNDELRDCGILDLQPFAGPFYLLDDDDDRPSVENVKLWIMGRYEHITTGPGHITLMLVEVINARVFTL